MKSNGNLSQAISLASAKFENFYDKNGQPYILHCIEVMHDVGPHDHELMSIAVLHDILEDTDITCKDLYDLGFSERIVNGIRALTHDKERETYDQYIKKVSTNDDAIKVKLADLKHNSDITRMKGLTMKDFNNLEKYHKAYEYLRKV